MLKHKMTHNHQIKSLSSQRSLVLFPSKFFLSEQQRQQEMNTQNIKEHTLHVMTTLHGLCV